MKSVIVDASFLVSLTNPKERHHQACVQVAHEISSRLIIPITVIPEAAHIIAKRISHRAMRLFISQMQHPQWQIETVTAVDLERAVQVLETYADAQLDFADSTIIAIAERLKIETILTLDRRDFTMIRPSHVDFFEIRP